MNGVNKDLRDEISRIAGVPCHFFLMHPHAWYTVANGLWGDPNAVQ